MGLHDEITAEIADAFDTDLADAVQQFTGSRTITTQSDDDWLTNAVGTTKSQIEYKGRGVFGGYAEIEVDNESILMTDVKLIALQAEVTGVPKNDDTVNDYKIVAVQQDPASVTFTIQLRKV